MGINTTIVEGIRSAGYYYGIESSRIEGFLSGCHNFPARQSMAIEIIEEVMTVHGKQKLLRYVVQLAKVELSIRELQPWLRDHVVHALLSYVLGVYINERFLRLSGTAVDPFQWKLAGLLHDVGYPAQVAKDILKPYTDQINHIKCELNVDRPDVYCRVVPVGLDELAGNVNSLDLIQKWLTVWGLDINARGEYLGMVSSGGVCHGMISSLSILYVVDLMYQHYNPERVYADIHEPSDISWNQWYFENAVVPACAAVFVHNLPERCFQLTPLDRNRASLPYLLRLSDCLQDWERPSAHDPAGSPDCDFDIEVEHKRLVFSVADLDRRIGIARAIKSSILAPDIDFRSKK